MIQQWLQKLAPRERWILLLGTLALLNFLGYVTIFAPFVKARTQLQQQVDAQQSTLAWMQQAAQEIAQLRSQSQLPPAQPQATAISLLSLIDKSTRQGPLATLNKRIEPKTEQEVLVEFDEINFKDLIRWLETLYNQSQIQVNNLNMERHSRAGMVKVRVTLTLTDNR